MGSPPGPDIEKIINLAASYSDINKDQKFPTSVRAPFGALESNPGNGTKKPTLIWFLGHNIITFGYSDLFHHLVMNKT